MERRPARKRGIWAIALLVLGIALIAGPMVFMVSRFVPVQVGSGNMLPTMAHEDILVLEKRPSEVRRGDVVAYDPSEWGLTGPFIGRVVAVGGDHIAYAQGDPTLTLNGQPLNESYVQDGDPGRGESTSPYRSRTAACSSWATTEATPPTPGSTRSRTRGRCRCPP